MRSAFDFVRITPFIEISEIEQQTYLFLKLNLVLGHKKLHRNLLTLTNQEPPTKSKEIENKKKPIYRLEFKSNLRRRKKSGHKVRFFYSDSAANAASRMASTAPTPAILRYFGAPGLPDFAQSP